MGGRRSPSHSRRSAIALAVAALSATVLRLTHLPDASKMVLVWQVGSVAVLTLLAALFGRSLLPWPKAFEQTVR
ncbi:MAG: NrsF family protein [Hyphomicrobiaceae bacterium]